MKVLVTGSAGFIGSTLAIRLLERGDEVVGVDNVNDYYDPALKEARLERVKAHAGFTEVRGSLEDAELMSRTFAEHAPETRRQPRRPGRGCVTRSRTLGPTSTRTWSAS